MQPEVSVLYRIQPQRVFEITNEHSQRRARARLMAVLRSSMFAKKRYQDFYINCSLNNLYNALRIAHFFHDKVPELSMTIRFVGFQIIEVLSDGNNKIIDRKRIEIKLTKVPTEEDRAEPGFSEGKPREQIQNPIQDILTNTTNKKEATQRPRKNYREREDRRQQPNRKEQKRAEPRQEHPPKVYAQIKQQQPKPKYRVADDERPQDDEQYVQREERGGQRKRRGGGNAGRPSEHRVQTDHSYNKSHIKH